MHNPYNQREPIRNPAFFYGRSQAAGQTLNQINHLQSVSLVGPPQIGKTSLLYYLAHPSVLAQYDLDPARYIFPFIDCSQLREQSQADIFRLMLDQALACLTETELELDLANIPNSGPLSYQELLDGLEIITEADRKIIFLFDTFEGMSQNPKLDAGFYSGLRGLAGELNLAYVTTSNHSLFDLTYTEGVLGSPFFNIFTTIRLGLLTDAETRSLIEAPARAAGLAFSEPAIAFILSLAGRHPANIQLVCYHAFELQARQGELQDADYKRLRQQLGPHMVTGSNN